MRSLRLGLGLLVTVLFLAPTGVQAQTYYPHSRMVTYYDADGQIVGGLFKGCYGVPVTWGQTSGATRTIEFEQCDPYNQNPGPWLQFPSLQGYSWVCDLQSYYPD